MNIKKIILEEIDSFDWIRDTEWNQGLEEKAIEYVTNYLNNEYNGVDNVNIEFDYDSMEDDDYMTTLDFTAKYDKNGRTKFFDECYAIVYVKEDGLFELECLDDESLF